MSPRVPADISEEDWRSLREEVILIAGSMKQLRDAELEAARQDRLDRRRLPAAALTAAVSAVVGAAVAWAISHIH